MTTSRRFADRKEEKFENIRNRGAVPETITRKEKDYTVGPVLLGFFVFVVIGSCNQDSDKWRYGLRRMPVWIVYFFPHLKNTRI